jgi:hypothetical protein
VFAPSGANIPAWGSETLPSGSADSSRANGA